MNRNRNNGKNQENRAPERKHVVMEDVELAKVVEPRPICSLCGQPIESIAEAITEKDGSYSHFDCVLKKLSEQYNVKEPEKVSYFGCGCFAVVGTNEEGKFYIKEKINYESTDAFSSMKKFVEASREQK